jgi:hypothetical protein
MGTIAVPLGEGTSPTKDREKRILGKAKRTGNRITWVTPGSWSLLRKAQIPPDGQSLRQGGSAAEGLPAAEENPWSIARRIPGEYFEVSGRRKEPYKDAGKAHSF